MPKDGDSGQKNWTSDDPPCLDDDPFLAAPRLPASRSVTGSPSTQHDTPESQDDLVFPATIAQDYAKIVLVWARRAFAEARAVQAEASNCMRITKKERKRKRATNPRDRQTGRHDANADERCKYGDAVGAEVDDAIAGGVYASYDASDDNEDREDASEADSFVVVVESEGRDEFLESEWDSQGRDDGAFAKDDEGEASGIGIVIGTVGRGSRRASVLLLLLLLFEVKVEVDAAAGVRSAWVWVCEGELEVMFVLIVGRFSVRDGEERSIVNTRSVSVAQRERGV
ncbi:hypothetical protein R3P38DRAFT_2805914 [Favolaschia claudopus]|uniref:Uncharacterized protein n=1 Tax=Favolaschia claudopus TaxID=2862362 RepID=A0AAV9ZLW1_9AGAR